MLQAAVRKSHGVDLARQADLAFAAPPIIHQKMLAGEFDAAINFWPYLARARARGLRFLTTTTQLADNVGLDTSAPLLAYIFSADFAGRHGPLSVPLPMRHNRQNSTWQRRSDPGNTCGPG